MPDFFWRSGPLLALGFVTPVSIYLVLNRFMLLSYVPLFIMLILVSGLGSKNFGQEFHNIGYFRGFVFLIASVLASIFAFTLRVDTWYGLFQVILILAISSCALVTAIVEVTIWGQRVSLRNSIGLTDEFFGGTNEILGKGTSRLPQFRGNSKRSRWWKVHSKFVR
jgi:hypothetical protein